MDGKSGLWEEGLNEATLSAQVTKVDLPLPPLVRLAPNTDVVRTGQAIRQGSRGWGLCCCFS